MDYLDLVCLNVNLTALPYIFVEKFYSCYRDGSNGGRDIRSFAGLYFVVRLMLFLSNGIGILHMVSDNDPFFTRNVILSATLLLVGLCRPYKKTHMIVLDVLLLAVMGLFCHLVSSSESFTMQNRFVFCASLMLCLPFVGIVVFIIVRAKSSKNHQNLRFQNNQNIYSKDGMLFL